MPEIWEQLHNQLCPLCGEKVDIHRDYSQYSSNCVMFLRQRIERLEQAMSELTKKVDDKERTGA